MLTDTFSNRYRAREFLVGSGLPSKVQKLLRQLAHVVHLDLIPYMSSREGFCHRVHDLLGRELGVFVICDGDSYEERCVKYLAGPYHHFEEGHGYPDNYLKTRLSLIEVMLREAEKEVPKFQEMNVALDRLFSWDQKSDSRKATPPDPRVVAVEASIREINTRMRDAGLPLNYHGGHIQIQDDDLSAEYIENPFWRLVADPKWANVEEDMKEAVDRRDSRRKDAAHSAMKALESVIKIISEDRGLTRGTENGAAEYIDNLVSKANGRFISTWEAENLKQIFKHLRNPEGHGPGSAPQPKLTVQQETWAIEAAMSWTKSLIHRL